MRKIFTLFLSVLFVFGALAQRPEAVIKKTDVKPKLDGVFDDVWATTDSLSIERPFTGTVPTLGEKGQTYCKLLWDDDGIFVIVNVTDNAYYPNYVRGSGNPWDNDKIELYFDVNYLLEDGAGPSAANSGHHQVAPDLAADKEGGNVTTETNGRQYAFLVTRPNYVAEYFVPWTSIKTKDGGLLDKTGVVGFDVTVNDSDPEDGSRRRAVWANDNSVGSGEAWSNMDECGKITFEGAEPGIYVDEIKLTASGNITTDNQTLQIGLEILPADATDKTVKWTIKTAAGGAARATLSPEGLLTPVMDEVVIIQAISADGFVYSNELTVTISGQKVTKEEINYIKNGDFTVFNAETGAVGAPWTGAGIVVNGVCSMNNAEVDADPWGWIMGQVVYTPYEKRADKYEFSFKMWADANREVVLDFEDPNNGWQRYGVSTDATATRDGGGKSDWLLPITTVPTWYHLTTTFENMAANARQQFNIMLGWDTPIVYVDSIYLINVNDKNLLSTAIEKENSLASFKVYPNPVADKLHVELNSSNTKVAIYNSVGIKMEEVTVSGTRHEFDVRNYTKGLYFVKANNSVVKFVK